MAAASRARSSAPATWAPTGSRSAAGSGTAPCGPAATWLRSLLPTHPASAPPRGPCASPSSAADTFSLRTGWYGRAMIATVDGFSVSLFLHITAVMVGFGSTFALSVTTPIAMKLNPRHLPYVHQLSINLNRFFAGPALVVVLATGFYQIGKGNWDYDFWVIGTLVIVVILGGLIGMVFLPTAK